MKLIFTESFESLKEKLGSIQGEWDVSQSNKKVLRHAGGVMNWYESTGTIQFQGKPDAKNYLERLVSVALRHDTDEQEPVVEPTLPPPPQPQQPPADPPTSSGAVRDVVDLYLESGFSDSEVIIGIVSAVGTESSRVITPLQDRLRQFGYEVEEIRVSSLLKQGASDGEYGRIKSLMNAGDELRKGSSNNAVLAYGVAKLIKSKRGGSVGRKAYVVNSLKHPDEVEVLRKIYGQGFYLFGVHADKKRRLHYLINDKGVSQKEAVELTEIDEDEKIPHGQRTRDTYHLSDFFINLGKNDDQVKNALQRFLELMFSHPYRNPTFDEFAMFMAFSSSVRSGDLSRQVGAVLAKNKQIVATGANDSPKFGGGLYWAEVDQQTGVVSDAEGGKDYTLGQDSNKAEQNEIISGIVGGLDALDGFPSEYRDAVKAVLEKSRIRDLTEFGRVVHAEMEALLSCSRAGISCLNAVLYCTTFPCHNCAKHLIAAGITRVVYVEPYPKSKALEFHADSIELDTKLDREQSMERVSFEPFTGVGARRFLDFFSMNLGAGSKLRRKNADGTTVEWDKRSAKARVSLLPKDYLDVEEKAGEIFDSNGGSPF